MRRMKVGNFSRTFSPLCNLMVHIIIRIWVQLELNYLLQMSQYLSIGLLSFSLTQIIAMISVCWCCEEVLMNSWRICQLIRLCRKTRLKHIFRPMTTKYLMKRKKIVMKMKKMKGAKIFNDFDCVCIGWASWVYIPCAFSPRRDPTRRSFIVIGQTLIIA